MFGAEKCGYQPDIITSAKGLTSGYSPLGAAIISDRIFEPFGQGTTAFPHGYTFGGHPVSCAVGLANLDLLEREDLFGNVLRQENAFRQTFERLYDLPIVGDVRGDGYFYAVELVKDKTTKQTLDAEEVERVLRNYIASATFENGLYCRIDDRGGRSAGATTSRRRRLQAGSPRTCRCRQDIRRSISPSPAPSPRRDCAA